MPTHAGKTGFVEIGCVVAVHRGMNAQILHIVKVFVVTETVVAGSEHLAHIVGLLPQQGVLLAAHPDVASLHAPVHRGVKPFKSFLTADVAHAAAII